MKVNPFRCGFAGPAGLELHRMQMITEAGAEQNAMTL
jgi:hypothetical protein